MLQGTSTWEILGSQLIKVLYHLIWSLKIQSLLDSLPIIKIALYFFVISVFVSSLVYNYNDVRLCCTKIAKLKLAPQLAPDIGESNYGDYLQWIHLPKVR